jgi:hypothetical protein
MNSDDVASIGENMVHHHVYEVALESGSILVRGLVDMITHGDGI